MELTDAGAELEKNEHFRYEGQMLVGCLRALHDLKNQQTWNNQFHFNAFHESFCVHAHNLMSFLPKPENEEEYFKYLHMIEDQILTLDFSNRTAVMSEKINWPKDHIRITDIINEQRKTVGLGPLIILKEAA